MHSCCHALLRGSSLCIVLFCCCSLCRSVDDKLKVLLEDIQTYVQEDESKTDKQDQGAFHRFSDTAEVLKYMQGACVKCVQE